jgi:hypothetical protein
MTLMYIQDDLTIRAKYCLSDNGGLVPGIDGCCFEASHIHTQDLAGCHSSNTPIVADPWSICLARRLRCLVTPSYLYLGIAPRVVSRQFRSKQYPTRVKTQQNGIHFTTPQKPRLTCEGQSVFVATSAGSSFARISAGFCDYQRTIRSQ